MFLEETSVCEKRFAINLHNCIPVKHDSFQVKFECMAIQEDNRTSFQVIVASFSKHLLEKDSACCMKSACISTKLAIGCMLKVQDNVAVRVTSLKE